MPRFQFRWQRLPGVWRFVFVMSALAAGTPLFLMGDEVGASKSYTYDRFTEEKQDLSALRSATGALLYRFYQDMIAFRLGRSTRRSANLQVLVTDDGSRVMAFERSDPHATYPVVGTLANTAYDQPGYTIDHPMLDATWWRECLNSDSVNYGGDNVGNDGATIPAEGNQLTVVIPANGVVVLEHVASP